MNNHPSHALAEPTARSMEKSLPHPDLYAALRLKGAQPMVALREPADFHDAIAVHERLVQAIWHDQLFVAANLKTRDGTPLEILSPGRWNPEGGPDFLRARLLIGREIVPGDVEIHLHSTGWTDHRHDANPDYDNVVLDVSLWEFGETDPPRTSKGKPVQQLILYPYLECSLEELVESLDFDRYPFPPGATGQSSLLAHCTPAEIISCVESAGLFRFDQKVVQALESVVVHGESQAAYMHLAEALGYRHNKAAFRQIASSVPLGQLHASPSIEEKIHALLAESSRHRLRVARIRPANHPQRRLTALAMLVHTFPEPAAWFSEILENPTLLHRPPTLDHPFWSRHYHLHSNRLPRPVALLGKDRWRDIVANTILPFCAALGRMHSQPTREERALEAYRRLPTSESNLASRQIVHDFGMAPPTTMLQQQGLIQIYQDSNFILGRSPMMAQAPAETGP